MAKPRTLSLAAGFIALQGSLLCTQSQAEPTLSGAVGATTDYLYRGVTQSNGEAALQAALQLQAPRGWTSGVWASTVDMNRDGRTGYEIDLHATHSWALDGDWSASLGLTHREYTNEGSVVDYEHDELSGAVSWQQRVMASIAWSPNTSLYLGRPVRGRTLAWELSLQQPLNANWSLFAGAGRYDLQDLAGESYTYWSAGFTFAWSALQLDVVHVGASEAARHLYGDYRGSRWTGALSVRF